MEAEEEFAKFNRGHFHSHHHHGHHHHIRRWRWFFFVYLYLLCFLCTFVPVLLLVVHLVFIEGIALVGQEECGMCGYFGYLLVILLPLPKQRTRL